MDARCWELFDGVTDDFEVSGRLLDSAEDFTPWLPRPGVVNGIVCRRAVSYRELGTAATLRAIRIFS